MVKPLPVLDEPDFVPHAQQIFPSFGLLPIIFSVCAQPVQPCDLLAPDCLCRLFCARKPPPTFASKHPRTTRLNDNEYRTLLLISAALSLFHSIPAYYVLSQYLTCDRLPA